LCAAFGLPRAAASLGGWARGLSFPTVVLALVLLLRFVRRHVLWRLRNRLIVTYVFIGVIPVVLLVLMALLAGYFFAGQFATFLATSDLRSEVSAVGAANGEAAAQVAAELRNGISSDRIADLLRNSDRFAQPERTIRLWHAGKGLTIKDGAEAPVQPVALPAWLLREAARDRRGEFEGIVWHAGRLRITAVRVLSKGPDETVVVSSEPVDNALVARLAQRLGVIRIYAPPAEPERRPRPRPQQGGVQVQIGDRSLNTEQPAAQGGALPPAGFLDGDFLFGTPLTDVHAWEDGRPLDNESVVLSVETRKSLLYARLSATLGDFSNVILIVLFVVAIFFAVIEILALFVGLRLTRSITSSVFNLYRATQAVNRGDFSQRIPVRSGDQLAALEGSFNSMTESIEKLLAEQKEKQRIEGDLAIAQEVQNQLFPHQVVPPESLEVYGICRPARTVSGDYYDFLPLGPEQVAIAVGDISGKGISAALLMATLHSAVRSLAVMHALDMAAQPALVAASAVAGPAEPCNNELQPAQWLELLNRHLYHSTPASKYATLFLSEYNGNNRTLTYSNGGHLAPLVITPGGGVRRLEVGGMVVGLFDGMQYQQESVVLGSGDIFLAYSDGITEPENEFGEFGEDRLVELVREHSALPLERIAEEAIIAVCDWIGGAEQPDDMTIVLARAR
ncbi:MAG: SpoIIE family protein phosphatase, partial [Acidobacteria bacterium]|nr:SpoIIE family protein phosphatase [Acidobacteriota bacterium]